MDWLYTVLGTFLIGCSLFGSGVAFVRWYDDRQAWKAREAELKYRGRPLLPITLGSQSERIETVKKAFLITSATGVNIGTIYAERLTYTQEAILLENTVRNEQGDKFRELVGIVPMDAGLMVLEAQDKGPTEEQLKIAWQRGKRMSGYQCQDCTCPTD